MANDNETHEKVCAEMRSFGDMPPPMFAWRDLADRAEAAHKREIEIAYKYSAEHEARTFDAVRKRDALIKELADALDSCLLSECNNCCGTKCNENDACVPQKQLRTLVARARKVV